MIRPPERSASWPGRRGFKAVILFLELAEGGDILDFGNPGSVGILVEHLGLILQLGVDLPMIRPPERSASWPGRRGFKAVILFLESVVVRGIAGHVQPGGLQAPGEALGVIDNRLLVLVFVFPLN